MGRHAHPRDGNRRVTRIVSLDDQRFDDCGSDRGTWLKTTAYIVLCFTQPGLCTNVARFLLGRESGST